MGNFSMLPLEIMLEILSRVPIESLLECKLVSKPWNNLFQHPSFSKLQIDSFHDSDGKLNFNFLFYTQKSSWYDRKPFYYSEYDENLNRFSRTARINLRTPCEYPLIHSSCYGLICFANFCYEPAYICNPVTREYMVFPIENKISVNGFGYSPSTNEFKVVRINWSGDSTIQVYTLGSGLGWRNVGKLDYRVSNSIGLFVDGAIHWMGEKTCFVVAFDLANEECRKFPSPPCTSEIVELHVLSGSLCACCYHDQGYGCHNKSIWVLKKSESIHDVIWSKEYSNIDISIRPIAFTKSGGLLCYDHHDKCVYQYSSKASSSRMLVNFSKCFDACVPHKNTLVSLKALGEQDIKLLGSCKEQDLAGYGAHSLANELNDIKLAAGLVFTEAFRSASLALRRRCVLLALVLQRTKRRVMRFFN